jgi:hypothetical protein
MMEQGVVAVMQTNQGDVRDDAAGVLRNCSNYSYEAAEAILQSSHFFSRCISWAFLESGYRKDTRSPHSLDRYVQGRGFFPPQIVAFVCIEHERFLGVVD